MNICRIIIRPGHVSSADGGWHYIGAGQLRKLYRVPLGLAPVIVLDDAGFAAGYRPSPGDVVLEPRANGDYERVAKIFDSLLPSQKAIIEEKASRVTRRRGVGPGIDWLIFDEAATRKAAGDIDDTIAHFYEWKKKKKNARQNWPGEKIELPWRQIRENSEKKARNKNKAARKARRKNRK